MTDIAANAHVGLGPLAYYFNRDVDSDTLKNSMKDSFVFLGAYRICRPRYYKMGVKNNSSLIANRTLQRIALKIKKTLKQTGKWYF